MSPDCPGSLKHISFFCQPSILPIWYWLSFQSAHALARKQKMLLPTRFTFPYWANRTNNARLPYTVSGRSWRALSTWSWMGRRLPKYWERKVVWIFISKSLTSLGLITFTKLDGSVNTHKLFKKIVKRLYTIFSFFVRLMDEIGVFAIIN